MSIKKTTSVTLLVSILFSAVACSESGKELQENKNTSSDASVSTTCGADESTDRDSISDDLPEKDYGGTVFTILDRTDLDYEFAAEEENADLMNDAIYRRNVAVEDRFGVDIQTYPLPCSWGDQATAFNNTLALR